MTASDTSVSIDIDEVRAEMSERGILELELGSLRAQLRKLTAKLQDEIVARVNAERALAAITDDAQAVGIEP